MDYWRNSKRSLKKNDNKNNSPRPKRGVYNNTMLPQWTRIISNNLIWHLKQLEKEQTKPKVNRRKEIVKNKAELEMKMKKIIAKISESKTWFFEKINIAKHLARLRKIWGFYHTPSSAAVLLCLFIVLNLQCSPSPFLRLEGNSSF